MKIIINISSWLLHHANRKYFSPEFYDIKNKLLKKYGKHICYDIQFIEGKKCHTCAGTGIFSKYYDNYGFVSDVNYCWSCDGTGWYKLSVWNILGRFQFGKYTFHQPYQRVYTKPDNSIPVIEGYIEHNDSRYSDFAMNVLFLIYRKGYLKIWIIRSINRKLLRLRNFFNRPVNWIQSYGPYETDELPY